MSAFGWRAAVKGAGCGSAVGGRHRERGDGEEVRKRGDDHKQMEHPLEPEDEGRARSVGARRRRPLRRRRERLSDPYPRSPLWRCG